jgi:tRNA1(Val) A37 N6-methylase TrmN6
MLDVSHDLIFGKRLRLMQPRKGHRAGTDAILAAAATPAQAHERVVDFGGGVGTIGLAVALRVPECSVTSVEIDEELTLLAQTNIENNALAGRVCAICADVATLGVDAHGVIAPHSVDHVVSNPPFHPSGGQISPDPRTARARTATMGLMDIWSKSAARILRPGGTFTLIHRPDALPELLEVLNGRFGNITIRPVHPSEGRPAVRVLVQGIKGSKAPLSLGPAVILRDNEGNVSASMNETHQQALGLPMRFYSKTHQE